MKCRTALEAAEALDEGEINLLTDSTVKPELLHLLNSYHDGGWMCFMPTRYARSDEVRVWFCLFVAAAEGEI